MFLLGRRSPSRDAKALVAIMKPATMVVTTVSARLRADLDDAHSLARWIRSPARRNATRMHPA